ncbi:hypothetical protein QTH11_03610 [Clostridium perfringens]|nr:hypothetical protein [Clostridium perfringens]
MENEKMNVIYYKRTGEIYTVVIGSEGLSIFGKNEEDFKLMLDSVLLEKNNDVLWNFNKFKIDIITNEIISKDSK